MKRLFILLSVLFIISGVKAQYPGNNTNNPNPALLPFNSLSDAITTKMTPGSSFNVAENGRISHFVTRKRSDGYTPNGITIIAMADSTSAALRDMSQAQSINAQWAGINGDATDVSAKLTSLLNLSVSTSLPVDGQGMSMVVNTIMPQGSSFQNATLISGDSTKAILRIGDTGMTVFDGYKTRLTLKNLIFKDTCSYGLLLGNITNLTIDNLEFIGVHAANDIMFLSGSYESIVTSLKFTGGCTAGVGGSCLNIDQGIGGVTVKGVYISAFTDYGIRVNKGTGITLDNPLVQGNGTGIFISGVNGLVINNPYFENTVNPVVADNSNGTPNGIRIIGGYWASPQSNNPRIAINNGAMIRAKNCQITLEDSKFTGVFSNYGSNKDALATVDGTAVITVRLSNVTGGQIIDLRKHLYRDSTANSTAGFNLEQYYTNNSIMKTVRTAGLANAHISSYRDATGNLVESSSWTPPLIGSGPQTITDVWYKTFTNKNLDTTNFFLNSDIYNKRYLILGQPGVTNAAGFIHLPENNSSLATGLTILPSNQRTGSAGSIFTILNADSSVIAKITHDGTFHAKDVDLSVFLNSGRVLAAPATSNGAPSWRALVASDIPDLPASIITSGTLPVVRGGTGLTSPAFGSMLYGNSTSGYSSLPGNTTTSKLFFTQIGDGTVSAAPGWRAIVAADVPNLDASIITTGTLPVTRGGNGLSTASLGDIRYGSAANTLSALAGNTTTTQKFLSQTGTGSASAAPAWNALAAGDIPNLDAAKITTGTLPVTLGGSGLNTATLGDLRYGSGTNTIAALAGNTTSTKKFLSQTGTGTVSAAPAWGTLATADISDISTNYQSKLTLTTTGSSGASTLTGSTLNIPNYGAASAVEYTLNLSSGTISSPVDATTYYSGENPSIAPQLVTGYHRIYLPKSGTIKRAVVHYQQTAGTNEASTLYIRLNNTTDNAISATIDNSATNFYQGDQLNIAVTGQDADGTLHDFIELKWITPTWATNPSGLRFDVLLYIEQ